jgi:hypothetical protein
VGRGAIYRARSEQLPNGRNKLRPYTLYLAEQQLPALRSRFDLRTRPKLAAQDPLRQGIFHLVLNSSL